MQIGIYYNLLALAILVKIICYEKNILFIIFI